MRLIDTEHPFFRPLWRRIAVTALCLGWATFELVSDSPGWAALFGAIGLYCGWKFLVNYQPRADDADPR